MIGANKFSEFLFERRDFGTLRDPAAQNNARRGVCFAFIHHGLDDGNHEMLFLFSRHQETRRCKPSSRPTVDLNPSLSSALVTSASRRETGLTFRSGPYSGTRFDPITRSNAVASSLRLVSVPLATLNTSSLMSDWSARTLARAISSM